MTEVGKNLDIQYILLIKHPQIFYFNHLILLSIIFDFLMFRCFVVIVDGLLFLLITVCIRVTK
jgi:hypothetical protein